VDDIFHYTGMGLKGNQGINIAQNRTLAESNFNGVEVFLFEVFEPGKYIHIGEVKLAEKPYTEEQPDIKGDPRLVWIFPLKVVNEAGTPIINLKTLQKKQLKQEREAKKLSNSELVNRAKFSNKRAGKRIVKAYIYERNPYVSELAKRIADGICQLCKEPAPFKDNKNESFLETHHIIWLSDNGPDTIENTVALCPNCHRKMHILDLNNDVKILMDVTANYSL
jgi:5-methylcytosine-specific restriction protein A